MKDYQRIGIERIEILAGMCKACPDKAKRYTFLMKKLSEKIGIPLPRKYKRWICRNCREFLIPGRNCTVRLKNKTRYVSCKSCGKVKRFIYAVSKNS